MRVAVLGTGTMSAPIARRLAAAGHEVRVWNRTTAKAEGPGVEVSATPREAVSDTEAVITILTDRPAVDAVVREALPGIELPIACATYERFSRAVELGHGHEDFAAAHLAVQRDRP